ncbi:hypothetical protein MMO60_27845 [Escherichia coli]|nr:hypothetical protein [Escherichia coli]
MVAALQLLDAVLKYLK